MVTKFDCRRHVWAERRMDGGGTGGPGCLGGPPGGPGGPPGGPGGPPGGMGSNGMKRSSSENATNATRSV
jgi:hypothetical protein